MMDQGLELAKQRKWQQAAEQFDRVLARAPMFERRAEMVPVYVEYAKQLAQGDDASMQQAAAVYRRVIAIDAASPQADKARSQLLVVEAKQLAARGLLDVTLLDQAVKLDSSNAEAQALRDKARLEAKVTQTTWHRYAAAVAIGVVALVAMVVVALVPRRKKQAVPSGPGALAARKEPSAAPGPGPDESERLLR